MKWLLLILGIIADLIGSACMKLSDGFVKLYPSICTFICRATAIAVFLLALKKLDLSFAYTIWSGIGIMGVTIIGIIYFKSLIIL